MQKLKAALSSAWLNFQQTFVGACATVLFGIFIMFISGVYDKLSQVNDITKLLIALEKRFDKLESKIEERDKATIATQMQGTVNSSELKGQIMVFQAQHAAITDEIREMHQLLRQKR
jgi:hypothetical protein